MTLPVIYLAGSISGHPDPRSWRKQVKLMFAQRARCIDPCNPIKMEEYFDPKGESILSRCHMHTVKANVVFANFLGATIPSLGTMAEIAWAWSHHVPIIVVCEDGNPNDYCMTRKAASMWYDNIEDGVAALDLILRDYYYVEPEHGTGKLG